jgi:GNAT superfamily N-acetyltransferase
MTEVLNHQHNRNDFDCGHALLNNYLKYQAGQDMKRKLSACFVYADPKTLSVLGYYTLSGFSIPLDSFPDRIQKKLPASYTSIPTTLLGRFAIDDTLQGKGYGKLLLIDAMKRCFDAANTIGSFAVITEPVDTIAEQFYLKHDFIKLPDSRKMFITTQTLEMLFREVT